MIKQWLRMDMTAWPRPVDPDALFGPMSARPGPLEDTAAISALWWIRVPSSPWWAPGPPDGSGHPHQVDEHPPRPIGGCSCRIGPLVDPGALIALVGTWPRPVDPVTLTRWIGTRPGPLEDAAAVSALWWIRVPSSLWWAPGPVRWIRAPSPGG